MNIRRIKDIHSKRICTTLKYKEKPRHIPKTNNENQWENQGEQQKQMKNKGKPMKANEMKANDFIDFFLMRLQRRK